MSYNSFSYPFPHLQEKAKEKKVPSKKDDDKSRKKLTALETQSDDISRIANAAKIIERMVNQNTFDDVSQGKAFCLFISIHRIDKHKGNQAPTLNDKENRSLILK